MSSANLSFLINRLLLLTVGSALCFSTSQAQDAVDIASTKRAACCRSSSACADYAYQCPDCRVCPPITCYCWNGKGSDMFDCSGLTWWAHKNSLDPFILPHGSGAQEAHPPLIDVPLTGPFQRGDLLFFDTRNSTPQTTTHVGLYYGREGEVDIMIHAEEEATGIVKSSISSGYYHKRLKSVKRRTTPVTTCPGNAIRLDGVYDAVRIPSDPSLSFGPCDQMTVEFWFNLMTPASDYDLISKRPTCDNDYNYQLHVGAGLLAFGNRSFRVDAPFAATIGQWYHVAATVDVAHARLFVNGDLKSSSPGGLGDHENDYAVTIGRAGGCANSTPFPGIIDEARIWNVARSEQQIAANYDKIVDPNSYGLVGYWNFDESLTDQTVIDRTGHGHNGTLGVDPSPGLDDPIRVNSTAQTCNTSTPPPWVFDFTGGPQTYVVPSSVSSIYVDARGGEGGGNGTNLGGKGGRVQTTLAVTPGEVLTIYVGGHGGSLCSPNTGGLAGFNGGGAGGIDLCDFNGPAPGGGGASDIMTIPTSGPNEGRSRHIRKPERPKLSKFVRLFRKSSFLNT